MGKQIMSFEEAKAFVKRNIYEFNPDDWMLSRCIDGRYEPNDTLEPLAKPGGDGGDLLIIKATCEKYGIELRDDDILDSLIEVVGGIKRIRFHTDVHAQHDKLGTARGCGHLKQASIDPEAYGVTSKDIDYIFDSLDSYKQQGSSETILAGDHLESAIIVIKSEIYSVKSMEVRNGISTQVFVYQKTLDNKRRRLLAKSLANKMIGAFRSEAEYLYQALSETSDEQLLETLNRLAKELPMYEVVVDIGGNVEIVEK